MLLKMKGEATVIVRIEGYPIGGRGEGTILTA